MPFQRFASRVGTKFSHFRSMAVVNFVALLIRLDDVERLLRNLGLKNGVHLLFDIDSGLTNSAKVGKRDHFLRRKAVPSSFNPMAIPIQERNPFEQTLAILLQGPILVEEDFTYKVIVRYLELFPAARILLSTWKDEVPTRFFELSKNFGNFEIIENMKPNFKGISNINLQITSTLGGVLRAKDLECEFVLKSRTDQVIIDSQALNKLKIIYEMYGRGLKNNRLIIADRNTFVFRLYGISDMFMFGQVDDIYNYWNCPHDNRDPSAIYDRSSLTLREYGQLNIVESYLATNYLKTMGHTPDFTLKDSLECFRDYFCVVDSATIKLRWFKYSNAINQWSVAYFPSKFQELSFLNWLSLQFSLESFIHLEGILDNEHDF